ncbi:4-(cytidine 5'-diphospho)-2-C-methyl-D-erythritol kinase [Dokdonella fugitiva]|jgi:4-diphosphocytidyl-2-C-methyl-D-erythritol kinase|uniref:4-diphosphocytidyl-2-C-methyl-D-erythritol kinase n=1 Tax=Dokdonella fugitiva TaxID=328517 RepID=A0A4R2IEI7_9GAMM|nr:4-(cytidine 5'-diphospho)-2-C-methyl-D-erythritol kinase [Dokdonella fugitiva]TCO42028.1 4-diphosphocytidyl-2-C-methyl-D-erythritol kinase [Dokdonella fugitiva]
MTAPAAAAAGWSEWPAPAKLNLFLHIVGRRADGYHLLETVFQLLDRGDTVRLRLRGDGEIRRVAPLPGVPVEQDLVVRAARALQDATGTRLGADIAVDKRIPMGGGLGGGSSDAASTLVGLDALWGCGLGEDRLAALGLGLGADVPVFVRGRSAWAEGVGERLVPIDLPPSWYVVVDPGVSVPTAALFQAPELTRDAAHLTIPLFLSGATTVNVFEPVVRERHAAVASALDWLARHGRARLSGSGGCVFVATPSREAAEAIARECPPGMRAWPAQGVVESPLLAQRRGWDGRGT